MQPYVGQDISPEVFMALCVDAYGNFRHPDVAPLVQLAPEHYLLELFHGPTLAFKDIALQLVGGKASRSGATEWIKHCGWHWR